MGLSWETWRVDPFSHTAVYLFSSFHTIMIKYESKPGRRSGGTCSCVASGIVKAPFSLTSRIAVNDLSADSQVLLNIRVPRSKYTSEDDTRIYEVERRLSSTSLKTCFQDGDMAIFHPTNCTFY